jgi:hypothetical protein
MLVYCLWPSKIFCKVSNGTSNVTKIAQIDEGMNKICLFQVKGVTGMMWVGTYDQFAFQDLWTSLYFLFISNSFAKDLDGTPNTKKSLKSTKE